MTLTIPQQETNMADLADLKFLKPTSPLLGGAIGIVEILSQAATGITTLTGVTIPNASGNAIGNGTLTFNLTNTTLSWTPPSGSAGTAVDVSADGTYAIQGANNGGVVTVTVIASSLPGANTSNTIKIEAIANGYFDDVTKDESDVGMIDYRLVYIKNDSVDTKKEVSLWVASNTTGEDTVSIGLDPAGTSAAGAIVASENTAPAGVTFTAPSTEALALAIGTLLSGEYYGFWVKRLVPAGVTTEVLDDTFSLAYSAKV